MTVKLSPFGPKPAFNDSNGDPLVGGKLYFYINGSTTPQNTYTDSTGGVANANPVVLNSRGEPTNEIWFTEGLTYKAVLKTSADVTIWSVDNITAIGDFSFVDEWRASAKTPTFVSATSFTLASDQTTEFHVGRRLKSTNTGGTIYSTVTASSFAASTTTITVANDSGVLDSGLSAVSYGIIRATNTSLGWVQSGTGATARTEQAKLRDVISLKDFGGATGDGSTNDSTGVLAADALGKSVFVPNGTYKCTTVAATDLDGPYWGDGQIKDSAGFKRGKFFSAIKAAPSSLGSESAGIDQAFNGDWSKGLLPVEYRITGTATLSQPTTGYTYTPEACPHYTYLYNESGWNDATATNVGRTAAVAYRTKVYQTGQGDAVAFNVSAFVNSARSGSTSYLANPAVSGFNGDFTAGIAGAYLNSGEFVLDDGGFDAAGAGWVLNLTRSVATGAKGAWWVGYRAQSIGSQPIDVGFSLTGKANFGLDLSFADFGANKAAITLSADQRMLFNVSATDATGLARYPAGVGGPDYITYASSISGLNFVVGNGSILQLTAAQTTSTQTINIPTGKEYRVNSLRVVTDRRTGWTDQTAAASRADLGGAPTAAQLSSAFRALYDDLKAHGLIGN